MGTLKCCKKKFTKDNYFNYGRKFALVSNVLFECISIALCIGGFATRFGAQTINSTTLQRIKDSAKNTYGVYLSTDNFRPITESLYQAFGIALILIGLFTAPFGVLGFYSFYRKKRTVLIAYVVIVGCLLFIQVIMSYHFITKPETVQQWIKPYLQEKIKEYYGIDSSDQVSLGWNYLMQEHQCCGIDSAADFQSSSYYTVRGGCYYYGYYSVPGCCKTLPVYNNNYVCSPYQVYCGAYSYDSNYWRDGCVQTLFNAYYSRNVGVIWCMTGIGMLVQILLFVFAVTLIKSTKCKIEPSASSSTSETELSITESHTITGEFNQRSQTQATLEPKSSAARTQQPKAMTTPAAAAAAPQPQPMLQSTALHQHSFYPAQPFHPGPIMLVPAYLDYGSNIPMPYMPVRNITTTHTQLPPPTPTALYATGEKPTYLQTPVTMQPENQMTLPPTPTQLPPRTETALPAPGEQPTYVQTPETMQSENQMTLSVTEEAAVEN